MVMIPDKLPSTPKEPTEEMRRKRELERVRKGLTRAALRLNTFLDKTRPQDVIKRVHTAKTEIINDQDEPEIVDYYSLWTEFADLRLTRSGWLLRCDYEDKLKDQTIDGFDKSEVITVYDMDPDHETYTNKRLGSLAEKLERFLAS